MYTLISTFVVSSLTVLSGCQKTTPAAITQSSAEVLVSQTQEHEVQATIEENVLVLNINGEEQNSETLMTVSETHCLTICRPRRSLPIQTMLQLYQKTHSCGKGESTIFNSACVSQTSSKQEAMWRKRLQASKE